MTKYDNYVFPVSLLLLLLMLLLESERSLSLLPWLIVPSVLFLAFRSSLLTDLPASTPAP